MSWIFRQAGKLHSWPVLLLGWACFGQGVNPTSTAADVRLITLDPGHFHAALLQKEMLPGVSEQVHLYAPLGPDLIAHLNRLAQFSLRPENPTRWILEVHAGPDFWERMLEERPGNVVVLSGKNRGKIDRIRAIVGHGLHVLADKPWIIEPEELPKLEEALEVAEQKGVIAYDAMTQRFEISCLVQKALVNDPEVFGSCLAGSEVEPAVYLESVHYLLKEVAGVPLLRPVWFFDVRQQGEGLTDLGTHLVDLVQWTLFPDQAINCRTEIQVLNGTHWPTVLTRAQFERVTGEKGFPGFLKPLLTSTAAESDHLDYFANNSVQYTLRGIRVRLDIRWDFEAPPGAKDTELTIYRGSKSRVDVRQGKAEEFRPEIYVVPNQPQEKAGVLRALNRRVELLQKTYPGLAVEERAESLRVLIPERHRVGHEAHFALLTRQFLEYVRHPQSLPAWEKSNMRAKYFVTTKGVELARRNGPALIPPKPPMYLYEKTDPLPIGVSN